MEKKKITKAQWIIAILLCAGIIIGALAILFALFFNSQRTFIITETFRIASASGSETYLSVALPMGGGYQEISNLLVDGTEEYWLEYFNGWRNLTVRIPSEDFETVITISFTARLFRNAQPWEGSVFAEYTLPQQFIDSDNEAIIALARELRGDNDFQTAQNIANYVYRFISWPPPGSRTGYRLTASELLTYPVGVCGDFANLTTALLRAEGIPARNISGLVFSANRIAFRSASDWGHPGGAHGWVEFFADGKWHFADPSWGWFNRNATAHLSFGTYDMYIRSDFQQDLMNQLVKDGFYLRGAMSAPFRFVLYSTDADAMVIPRGYVRFSWFR